MASFVGRSRRRIRKRLTATGTPSSVTAEQRANVDGVRIVGFSWQITPRVLNDSSADPDPAVRKRVFETMMTMRKIDVAVIEAARRGASS
jgi:hypothetical protein